jgi:DDE superfamily endonuclease
MTAVSVDFSKKHVLDRKTHLTGTVARVWALIGFNPPELDPDWKIPPIVCVDSFIVPIPRPTGWEAQKPFFSKKHHQHAVKVQIVTVNRNVACLSPPEVASVSDSSLLERNPIPAAFNKGNVYGDKAYPRDKIVRPRKKNESGYIRHVSSWISKIRVDVEHEIKDLKDFKALRGHRLRDPLESLGGVLCLVANAVRLAA